MRLFGHLLPPHQSWADQNVFFVTPCGTLNPHRLAPEPPVRGHFGLWPVAGGDFLATHTPTPSSEIEAVSKIRYIKIREPFQNSFLIVPKIFRKIGKYVSFPDYLAGDSAK